MHLLLVNGAHLTCANWNCKRLTDFKFNGFDIYLTTFTIIIIPLYYNTFSCRTPFIVFRCCFRGIVQLSCVYSKAVIVFFGTTRTSYAYWRHNLQAGGCSLGLFILGRWMLRITVKQLLFNIHIIISFYVSLQSTYCRLFFSEAVALKTLFTVKFSEVCNQLSILQKI